MKLIYRAFYALFACAIVAPQVSYSEQFETLDTLKTYNIDEVIVESSRSNSQLKNLPQKVEIITQEEIQSTPSNNLAELLKRTTNVDIIQYPGISAAVGMRGFSPSAHSRSYTLLLINGKPAGTTNIASIVTANIERIEVAKGPYATLYGSDAMGGVINIITKTATEKLSGSANVEYGSYDLFSAEAFASGKIVDDVNFGIGASTRQKGDEYRIGESNLLQMSEREENILDSASYGDKMTYTSYDISHINGLIDWHVNEKLSVNAEAIYTFSDEVLSHGNYFTHKPTKKSIDRLNIYGSIEYAEKNHTILLSPYYAGEKAPNSSFISDSEGYYKSFESDIADYGFQLQDRIKLNEFTIIAGADFATHDYKSKRFKKDGTSNTPYKPNNDHTNYAVFTQATYNTDKLDINAGLRLDYFEYNIEANEAIGAGTSNNSYNTLNPSIGAQYRLNNNVKLHTSFGTAFSVPDAYKTAGSYDTYKYFEGNEDLEPEKSRTIDVGIKFNDFDNGITCDISYFNTNHDNRIVEYSKNDTTTSFKNANASLMHGLEINAKYNIGALYNKAFVLELYANWTYLFDANYDETLEAADKSDSIVTRNLLYVRKSNGNFGIYYKNQLGISARLNGRYVGSRFEKDSFSKYRTKILSSDYYADGGYTASNKILKHPDYLLFDASVKYTLKNNIEFGVLISNLFDENYSEKDGYNMPGRQFKVKLGYKF